MVAGRTWSPKSVTEPAGPRGPLGLAADCSAQPIRGSREHRARAGLRLGCDAVLSSNLEPHVSSQSTPSSSGRSTGRIIAVALLSLFVFLSTIPGLSIVWDSRGVSYGPQGPLGFVTDYDGIIKTVEPDSQAAAAVLRPGDCVDLKRTPFESRYFIVPAAARIPAGTPVHMWVWRDQTEREVTLVSSSEDYPWAAKLNLIARTLSTLIFVVVGGLLVLLRPSTMTWGFFFYCLGFSPGIAFGGFSRFPPVWLHLGYILIVDVLSAAGTVGILVFALHFLCDQPPAWRRALDRSIPFLFATFVCLITYPDLANIALGLPAETVQRIMLSLQGAVFGVSLFAALQTYLYGRPDDRPRMQWVVVGLCVGILGTYLGVVLLYSSELPFNPPRWLQSALLTLNVFLPISVAYAVIRHRVLEVSFVVSRALIYGVLTFVVLSLFAFIDWFVGRELEAVRLASYVEIAVAVGLSFWLNSLEKRVETVVATVFFRKRRQAMLRLERAAEAVQHASKISTVFDYLVREPVEALALSSAALFRPDGDGSYRRVAATGWPDTAATVIDRDDPLALELAAEAEPLRPVDIGWHHGDLPARDAAPILAVPIVLRRELLGIALYGAHTNGADIDPDEVSALFHLARATQATYDHLRSLELEARVEQLQEEVATLQAKPGELAG